MLSNFYNYVTKIILGEDFIFVASLITPNSPYSGGVKYSLQKNVSQSSLFLFIGKITIFEVQLNGIPEVDDVAVPKPHYGVSRRGGRVA